MAKIFITGITGFLGSNIAGFLIKQGHSFAATYRNNSSRELCRDYLDKVQWVLQDEYNDWIDQVVNFKPDIIIHSAWIGVSHEDRNNWECQFRNLEFIKNVLSIAENSNAIKFIGLGSQAEYGKFDGCIKETHPTASTDAYGCIKIVSSELVKQFCENHKIDWYWLRVFSVFGKGESETWLIPSLVKKVIMSDTMDLTLGEQKYAYLYVNDLGIAINNILLTDGKSGVYNLSAKKAITIRQLVTKIKNMVDDSFKLNFGKLPYRANQSMHMQGNSSKFIKAFGNFDVTNFDEAISDTIENLKQQFIGRENEGI